ncbi:FAD-binding oxidoreductase [Patescibacteria group bacterium]|nr:FAD-binding oxidoreductase [Patescibacteria group bacterium]
MNHFNDLKKIIAGEAWTDAQTLDAYSHDASLFALRPEAVVFPRDAVDVGAVVRYVSDAALRGERVSITPRSAGTDMSGGAISESIIVDVTRHINRIKEIGSEYAVVEPGMLYRDFEKETLKHGLLLPCYPASRELCAIGGMIANNCGGEKTLVYGKMEKYVREITMVLRDGNPYVFRSLTAPELEEKKKLAAVEGKIYRGISELVEQNYELLQNAKPRVSKNSSGYYLWNVLDKAAGTFDLTKLIVGSQGTLGVITEAKIALIKPKAYSRLLVIFLRDMSSLASVINHVLKFQPESFESYDDHTFTVALKLFPAIAKQLRGNIIRMAFQFFPEFWMAITGGIPKLVLLAEFTGDSAGEAEEKANLAEKSLADFHLKTKITKSDAEAEKYWVVRRESFNLLRHRVKNMRTAPFIDDIALLPEQLPEFLPKLYAMLNEYDILYTIAGHAGDANFHIIPLMDFSRPDAKKIIEELAEKVYKLVFDFHGTMSGEHNDGLIRGPYLEMMYGKEVYHLFEQTKQIFDPHNIFNPGKKTGASLKYALDHIRLG